MTPSSMDIPLLRAFLDLADSCHFARTSERQHVSPSTLSRMISRLEDQVGARLFERSNRSVSLSPAGMVFQSYAMNTLQAWEELQTTLRQQDSPLSGEISLYCSVTASHSLLADILGTLRLRHAGLEIKLHTGDQANSLQRLQAGHEDMVIAARPVELPQEVEFRLLYRSRLVFIAPRSSAQVRDNLQASMGRPDRLDWGKTPLILAEAGLARQFVQAWLADQGIKPDIYAQVSGHEAIVSMVGLGCGIAAVPELVLEASPVRDSIRVIEGWPELPDFEIGLCTLKQRLDEPLLKAVWEAARPD